MRFFNTAIAHQRRYRFTRPGDLLLTTRDLTQAAEFLGLVSPIATDRPYLVNQGANVIRLTSAVDERFFVYWSNGPIYRAHVRGHFVGSTQINLRKQDFLDAPLWLPPKDEKQQGLITAGDDLPEIVRFLRPSASTYRAADVITNLLSIPVSELRGQNGTLLHQAK